MITFMEMIHLAHIEVYVLPVSSDCEDFFIWVL